MLASVLLGTANTTRVGPNVGGTDPLVSANARKTIDAYCDHRASVARDMTPAVLARVYGAGEIDGAWRVANAPLLRRIARDPNLYSDVARVYSIAGTVAIVTTKTRSLDYHLDAEACYRDSGTLAREHESSSGTVNSDEEARYLDDRGRIVAQSSKLSPLAPQPGASVSPDVRAAVPQLYRFVRELPFWSLIGR